MGVWDSILKYGGKAIFYGCIYHKRGRAVQGHMG